jgi:hypothetical protein
MSGCQIRHLFAFVAAAGAEVQAKDAAAPKKDAHSQAQQKRQG